MEVTGVERIFGRSIEKKNVFLKPSIMVMEIRNHLLQLKMFMAKKMTKKQDCIRHVQKHVGSRLRKFKKN